MGLALLTWLLVTATGLASGRVLWPGRGLSRLGQAPAIGLAVLAVVSTWTSWLGLPAQWPAGLLLAASAAGCALAIGGVVVVVARHSSKTSTSTPEDRLALALGLAAFALPIAILAITLGSVQAPLSTHDGAFHVERIETLRQGERWLAWYPPGLHTSFSSILMLVPGIDTAEGAFGASLALVILAPLAAFGLAYATWRDRLMAATCAVLTGLTYLFPYSLHIWSGWPLALAIILVLGVWSAATEYVRAPGVRLALVVALETAAIVLVHGSELYTAAIGILALAVAGWRKVAWRRLPRDVLVVVGVSAVLVLPYLPNLLNWAAEGGAYAVGNRDGAVVQWSIEAPYQLFRTMRATLGVDLPVRALLLPAGVWWIYQTRTGTAFVAIAAVFFGLALAFSFVHHALLRWVFALVFPWGQEFRLMFVVAVALVLVEGAGIRAVSGWVSSLPRRWRTWPSAAVGVVLAAVLVLSGSAMTNVVSAAAAPVITYAAGTDDAAVMHWLRQNGSAGEVLVNDTFADAGIWAPYKAGIAVLMPRGVDLDREKDGQLILADLADLASVPAAAAAACRMHIRYVFKGASGTRWEKRQIAPVAELRHSPGMTELFSSGQAAILGIRLPCPADVPDVADDP
jgi:hypothetical protein